MTRIAIRTIWTVPLDIETRQERNSVLSLAIIIVALVESIVHVRWSIWAHVVSSTEGQIESLALVHGSGMNEAASFAIRAASSDPEGPADLRLVLGMTRNGAKVVGTMGKLALDAIAAALLFLPVTADLGLVQANLAIVSTRSADG